ncbi:MAG: SagB/ThcOx family dehydrogenase [Atribacterota bacterium]|jgi:SagB-type dehydrogenase family enzyme|nr:SagB/ThcOx family dehydrogenase [Atribacterota bacterium]
MGNKIIKLPIPQKELSFPLMKALERRRSKRRWIEKPLSEQELSNLLWAACGITKQQTKNSKSKRTAPSACNSQEIKVYIALEKGLFLFDEKEHQLIQILNKDIRADIGTQKMMQLAPVGLIYVADFLKMKSILFSNEQKKWFFSVADTGFICQNIYLYCAATNLNTVVLGLVDRDKLHEIMDLQKHEKIVFTQVVGHSSISV